VITQPALLDASGMTRSRVLEPRDFRRYDRDGDCETMSLGDWLPASSQQRASAPNGVFNMSVIHTSRMRVEKHEGPHRTARLEGFAEPIHFGIHGGIRQFYGQKYGREIIGLEYPATLDHIIAGVAG
jgi:hypothetical protein